MEEFLSTGKLFLVIWGVCLIIVPLGAAWLTGAKSLKYGLILGTIVGLMAANVAIAERSYGIPVIILEAFVIVAVGILYLLATNKRTYESDRFGRSKEQGLCVLLNPKTPVERTIKAAGDAQIGIINAQTRLTDAETRYLIAESRAWIQQAEPQRLRITGRDR